MVPKCRKLRSFEPTVLSAQKKPSLPAKVDYVSASWKTVRSTPPVLWFQNFCKARLTFIW